MALSNPDRGRGHLAPSGRCKLAFLILLSGVFSTSSLAGQDSSAVREHGDSVTIRFVDADLRAVIQALTSYLPKPAMVANIPASRVSLETPGPVGRNVVVALLKGLVETQNLVMTEDSSFIRIGPKPAGPSSGSPETVGAAGGAQPIQLFVYRLKHARAGDVAATVNLLFGGSGGFSGSSGLSSGTLSDELRRQSLPVQPAGPQASRGAAGPDAPRQSTITGSVTIVPDELTNSLLVRASPADYDVLRAAVDQLDIRPLQVLIEVLIVEARRDKSFSFGANLLLPPQSLGGNATVDAQTTGTGLGDFVLRLLNIGKADLDATISASESRGDVQIISRPVLLASNNVEARFLVGSQRPFVQVSRSLPTDNPSRDQVIQYRDVGTKLTVRPTINQDGYVSLLIQQEVNAATSEVAFDAPVISTREASTQVLVRDGQTIVLGGLQDRQKDRTNRGIPVLSSLPVIGGLFGSNERRTSSTELYLFLTPRIIRTDEDADRLTAPRLPAKEGT